MNQKIIKRIVGLMNLHGISLEDLAKELNQGKKVKLVNEHFDLLVEINGKKKRVSYQEGKELKVLGIFPFKQLNVYLESDETEETYRRGADEQRIPSLSFWQDLASYREKLNKDLADLNKPVIEGFYFATTAYGSSDLNWIISYRKGEKFMGSDYYGDQEKARIRYLGVLE